VQVFAGFDGAIDVEQAIQVGWFCGTGLHEHMVNGKWERENRCDMT
jgi:hypothetical protein